jgi:hypothetical protein
MKVDATFPFRDVANCPRSRAQRAIIKQNYPCHCSEMIKWSAVEVKCWRSGVLAQCTLANLDLANNLRTDVYFYENSLAITSQGNRKTDNR